MPNKKAVDVRFFEMLCRLFLLACLGVVAVVFLPFALLAAGARRDS